jgi:dephospho-CoA kinase
MFIAIIGTPCSGKTTVKSYLISKGFKLLTLADKGVHQVRSSPFQDFFLIKTGE